MIQIGPVVANYMIGVGLLEEYFELFMSIQKYLTNSSIPAAQKETSKYHASNILMILRIIECLFKSCITQQMYDTKTLPPSSHYYESKDIDWDNIPALPYKLALTVCHTDYFKKCFIPMQEKCDSLVGILQ